MLSGWLHNCISCERSSSAPNDQRGEADDEREARKRQRKDREGRATAPAKGRDAFDYRRGLLGAFGSCPVDNRSVGVELSHSHAVRLGGFERGGEVEDGIGAHRLFAAGPDDALDGCLVS